MREKKLPIFCRGDYWYCYVRTPDGKRHQRALHIRNDGSAASERAAIAAYWQEQARATAGTDDRARAAKPLSKALAALTAEQELAGLTDHSHDVVFYRGRWLVKHFGPTYDLTQLSTESMVEYATEACKTREPSTVRMELDVLVRCAKAVGLTPPKRPRIKGTAKRQRPLTREQLRLFFLALHPRQRLLGLTLVTLGPRASEPSKIPDDGIDWDRQTLWVNGTKTNGSRRQLPIPDELFAFMNDLRQRGQWNGFPKQSRNAVYAIVRAACLRAFGEPRSVNDIRGTWATLASLDGVPADIRAAFQGNSPEMQARTYAQPALMPDELRKSVERGIPRIRGASACIKSASETTASAEDTSVVDIAVGRND